MIELRTGDIILAKGRKFRSKLALWLRGASWNHAAMYYKYGCTMEIEGAGLVEHNFYEHYAKRQIVILRLAEWEDDVRTLVDRFMWQMQAAWDYNIGFDRTAFFLEMFRFPRLHRPGRMLCDDFVHLVYRRAAEVDIDVKDLMLRDHTDQELLEKFGLVRVFDYREGVTNVE